MVRCTLAPILQSDSGATGQPLGKRMKGYKSMLTSIARLYQAWKRHEAVKRELSHLTDRELADIGITRSDIDRIASQEAHNALFDRVPLSKWRPPIAGAFFAGGSTF
jgi:uncharacterized protein YjiS (DUF1127 family)